MASESSDPGPATVTVPSALDEWLDAKASELDVDRETLVVQVLASYRAASELDDRDLGALLGDRLEPQVRDIVAERIPDIASAVSDQVDTGSEVAAAEDRLDAEIDRVETEFTEKIQDVRERVIQVKREADAKASDDHTHPELDELDELEAAVAQLRDRIDDVDRAVEDQADRQSSLEERVTQLEDAADRLDDVEERLKTVAWVVSDLRDAVDQQSGSAATVDRLKRAAAEADVDRAVCDNCEKPVDIALLTEAACPHCEKAVTDVDLPSGFFGKPRLSGPQQLESGEEDDTADPLSDIPDNARRE